MQPVKLPCVMQHLSIRPPGGRPLGQVSYRRDCSLNTPDHPAHTRTHTPSRPLPRLSPERAINTPPPTACTHVMEGKRHAEEEDSRGNEGEETGERRGSGGQRVR